MEMSALVTAAVLAAALLHASWNALLKSSADKLLDTVAISLGGALIGLLVAPFLPAPSAASIPWLLGSTLLHILYFAFLAGAYRWGDLSFTYPIMRGGGPMLVALAGVTLLDETLAPQQWLGLALVVAGILAFAVVRQAAATRFGKALAFALANAAVIAAYTLVDAQGARVSGSPVAYTLWFFVANGVVLWLWAGARRGAEVPRYMRARWKHVAAGAICSVGAYAIALWAMTRAPVALVAVLRETSVIFAAVLGALFLGERFTPRRVFATACVLAGLVALRL